MTEGTKGLLAMVGACSIWGLSPIYYKLLAHIPAFEVLANRMLWSFLFARSSRRCRRSRAWR